MLKIAPTTKVVLLRPAGQDVALTVRAITSGAYDFLLKPIVPEELRLLLRRCFYLLRLEQARPSPADPLPLPEACDVLGASPPMVALFTAILRIASTDAPVLLLGEAGTGKASLAHTLHQHSTRRQGPWQVLHCGALPAHLLEEALFGVEGGDLPDSGAPRLGHIERTSGGTLFLDEAGRLPGALQSRLLRLLQSGVMERGNGAQPVRVDTRILAASAVDADNPPPHAQPNSGFLAAFSVATFWIPPLRDRREDILLLAKAFLHRTLTQAGRAPLEFDPSAVAAIHDHRWPGNLRELHQRVMRASVLTAGPRISAADLGLTDAALIPRHHTLRAAREALERRLVTRALRKHRWKISGAAAELGISRPTLYEMLERLGISRENVPLPPAS
jgi:two-component system NtrC family response regulator